MKKLLVIGLIGCIMFMSSGCGRSTQDDRFVIVDKVFNYGDGASTITILEDRETKVLYLMRNAMYKGGITVWLDADGKPMKAEK